MGEAAAVERSGLGMACEIETTYPHAALFGEDQSRYIMTVKEEWANMFAANCEGSSVFFSRIGRVQGERLVINDLIDTPVDTLKRAHESWFPDYMNGPETAVAAE